MVAGTRGEGNPEAALPDSGFPPLRLPSLPIMTTAAVCSSCGAPLAGRFCSQCGAAAAPGGRCVSCGAELSAGAKFCHRCGAVARAGVPASRERTAWAVAAVAMLLVVAAVAYLVGRGAGDRPAVAEMGNAGNAGSTPGIPAGRAPDISTMTPRERFDRLWNRVMTAAESGAADTVRMFAPMALGAYEQLDSVDLDARFHAAMIHVAVGNFAPAQALADSIAAEHPGHLFAIVIRADAAERANDVGALDRAYADFLARYDAEMKANRREYADHRPMLDDFHTRASASVRK
jgi:hypothetical protein